MDYICVCLRHALDEVQTDLLTADLGAAGFESFETEEGVLKAYIPQVQYRENKARIEDTISNYAIKGRKDETIEDQDWNAVWESAYEPVRFGDFCFVHAPFHTPLSEVRHNICIEPKMSFGTAHHPTTALMIRFLQENPPFGESVLDMGCGTGVLGILAGMQGAAHVSGIDVDEWAYRNASENVRKNGFSTQGDSLFTIELGDAALLKGRVFDRIIANINRNILVRDMPAYATALKTGGTLYLSGFYLQDMEIIEEACNSCRLFYRQHHSRDEWAAMQFVKK